jgi:hypothetical protein
MMHTYCEIVVGFAWSKDPASNAGGSVAKGKVSYTGQIKGDDPGEKGIAWSSSSGIEHGTDLYP